MCGRNTPLATPRSYTACTALMAGTVTTFAAVKDMEARRMLHAGEALRTDDVRRPVVVTKGQTITMLFRAPGVELTAMGRAMGEGGRGGKAGAEAEHGCDNYHHSGAWVTACLDREVMI